MLSHILISTATWNCVGSASEMKSEETQLGGAGPAAFSGSFPGLTNRAQLLPRPGPPGKAVAGLTRSEPHPSGPHGSIAEHRQSFSKGQLQPFPFPKLTCPKLLGCYSSYGF